MLADRSSTRETIPERGPFHDRLLSPVYRIVQRNDAQGCRKVVAEVVKVEREYYLATKGRQKNSLHGNFLGFLDFRHLFLKSPFAI